MQALLEYFFNNFSSPICSQFFFSPICFQPVNTFSGEGPKYIFYILLDMLPQVTCRILLRKFVLVFS